MSLLGRRGGRRLAGARVLLTGASSGVGGGHRARLQCRGRRPRPRRPGTRGPDAHRPARGAEGAAAHVLPADVSDRAAIEGAVNEAADALGGLDVVVVNVASVVFGPFREVEPRPSIGSPP